MSIRLSDADGFYRTIGFPPGPSAAEAPEGPGGTTGPPAAREGVPLGGPPNEAAAAERTPLDALRAARERLREAEAGLGPEVVEARRAFDEEVRGLEEGAAHRRADIDGRMRLAEEARENARRFVTDETPRLAAAYAEARKERDDARAALDSPMRGSREVARRAEANPVLGREGALMKASDLLDRLATARGTERIALEAQLETAYGITHPLRPEELEAARRGGRPPSTPQEHAAAYVVAGERLARHQEQEAWTRLPDRQRHLEASRRTYESEVASLRGEGTAVEADLGAGRAEAARRRETHEQAVVAGLRRDLEGAEGQARAHLRGVAADAAGETSTAWRAVDASRRSIEGSFGATYERGRLEHDRAVSEFGAKNQALREALDRYGDAFPEDMRSAAARAKLPKHVGFAPEDLEAPPPRYGSFGEYASAVLAGRTVGPEATAAEGDATMRFTKAIEEGGREVRVPVELRRDGRLYMADPWSETGEPRAVSERPMTLDESVRWDLPGNYTRERVEHQIAFFETQKKQLGDHLPFDMSRRIDDALYSARMEMRRGDHAAASRAFGSAYPAVRQGNAAAIKALDAEIHRIEMVMKGAELVSDVAVEAFGGVAKIALGPVGGSLAQGLLRALQGAIKGNKPLGSVLAASIKDALGGVLPGHKAEALAAGFSKAAEAAFERGKPLSEYGAEDLVALLRAGALGAGSEYAGGRVADLVGSEHALASVLPRAVAKVGTERALEEVAHLFAGPEGHAPR